ncbi:MAG: hypothetical protein FWC47_05335 [Oscillospiraceae bacterium]|nr:hypothetical protein [Oscillospiraceae bacterium]
MSYSHVIWDFNGTILDDVEAVINSENIVLKRHNLPYIQDIKQYQSVFTFF